MAVKRDRGGATKPADSAPSVEAQAGDLLAQALAKAKHEATDQQPPAKNRSKKKPASNADLIGGIEDLDDVRDKLIAEDIPTLIRRRAGLQVQLGALKALFDLVEGELEAKQHIERDAAFERQMAIQEQMAATAALHGRHAHGEELDGTPISGRGGRA